MLYDFPRSCVFSFDFSPPLIYVLLKRLCIYIADKVMLGDGQQVVAELYLPHQYSQVFVAYLY